MNAWDHLPNAKHIDRLRATLKYNIYRWASVEVYPSFDSWDSQYIAACDIVRNGNMGSIWVDAGTMRCGIAPTANFIGAVTCLLAYDSCAHMLDSDIGELKILAALGDPRAVLLLPATIMLKELSS